MADKQNNQSSIDRQYLKAIGVDLWVERDNAIEAVPRSPQANSHTTATSGAAIASTAASQSTSVSNPTPADQSPVDQSLVVQLPADRSLADLSAAELAVAVTTLKVSCNEPGKAADLLLVTEATNLTPECTKLLESMFKAIEIDRTQWIHAGISPTKDAIHINQLESTVSPKALVMMLKTSGDPAALQSLRGVQHKVTAHNSFMVVSFHPQDLLDNPEIKRPAWEDLKQLRQWLS